MTDRKIGELNGKWSILFRALLSVSAFILPFLVGLQAWFVTTIQDIRLEQVRMATEFVAFAGKGPRYSAIDARADLATLKAEILATVDQKFPPPWLVQEVESLNRRLDNTEKIRDELHEFEREFSSEFVRKDELK